MSIMVGADPDRLDDLAADLTASAERLRALQGRLGSMVRQCPWQGRDAADVRAQWEGRYSAAITGLAADLDQAATVAARNAAEQRQASAADGPGASGAVAGVGSTRAGPAVARAAFGADPDLPAGPGQAEPAGPGDELSTSGAGSVGAGPLSAEGSFDAGVRLRAEANGPEGEVSGLLAGQDAVDEDGHLVIGAAEVSAGTGVTVADAHARGTADLGGVVHAEGQADAALGAEAQGNAGVSLTDQGLAATAGVSAFAGAQASAQGSLEAGGQQVEAEGHVTAGLELKANAELEVSADKIELSIEAAAALGIGAGGKVDITIDPQAAAEEVEDLLDDLW